MALWFTRTASKPGISTSISSRRSTRPVTLSWMSPSRLLAMLRAAFSFTSISIQPYADLFQRARTGAAAAAQLGNLPYKLQQLAAHRLDLVVVQAASAGRRCVLRSQRTDAPVLQPFPPRGGRRDLGLPARLLRLGAAPQRFRRLPQLAARLGKLGLAHGLHLLHFASPLLGGGGGLSAAPPPLPPRTPLPPPFRPAGALQPLRPAVSLPPTPPAAGLGHLVAPALLGRLRLAPRRGDLRRNLRPAAVLSFSAASSAWRRMSSSSRRASSARSRASSASRRARSASRLAAEAASSSRDFLQRRAPHGAPPPPRRDAAIRQAVHCRSSSVGTARALVRGGLSAGDGAASTGRRARPMPAAAGAGPKPQARLQPIQAIGDEFAVARRLGMAPTPAHRGFPGGSMALCRRRGAALPLDRLQALRQFLARRGRVPSTLVSGGRGSSRSAIRLRLPPPSIEKAGPLRRNGRRAIRPSADRDLRRPDCLVVSADLGPAFALHQVRALIKAPQAKRSAATRRSGPRITAYSAAK